MILTLGWPILLENVVVYFYVFNTCLVGIRGSYIVSLGLLLRYLWGVLIVIGPLFIVQFVTIQFALKVRQLYSHAWQEAAFNNIRYYFCIPQSTYMTTCNTPFYSYNYNVTLNVTQYCLEKYQSTDCESIRDAAMNNTVFFSRIGFICIISVGLTSLILLCYGIYISYSVITLKIFTQSMNANVNYLLLVGGIACGIVVGNHDYIYTHTYVHNYVFTYIHINYIYYIHTYILTQIQIHS